MFQVPELTPEEAKALKGIKDPRVVEALIYALGDVADYVSEEASKALVEIKDPRVIELLTSLIFERWMLSHVRIKAVQTLAKIKDSSVVELLIRALEDKEDSFRIEVVKALKKITGQDFGDDKEKWQK